MLVFGVKKIECIGNVEKIGRSKVTLIIEICGEGKFKHGFFELIPQGPQATGMLSELFEFYTGKIKGENIQLNEPTVEIKFYNKKL